MRPEPEVPAVTAAPAGMGVTPVLRVLAVPVASEVPAVVPASAVRAVSAVRPVTQATRAVTVVQRFFPAPGP